MNDLGSPQLSILNQVDAAPVGDAAYDQLGDLGQHGLRVWPGSDQDPAGIREQPRFVLDALAIRNIPQSNGEQPGSSDLDL